MNKPDFINNVLNPAVMVLIWPAGLVLFSMIVSELFHDMRAYWTGKPSIFDGRGE